MPERTCSVDGCEKIAQQRDWCPMHYQRWRKYGDVGPSAPLPHGRPKVERQCSIEDCDRPHNSRGWCAMHYSRWKRYGDPLVIHGRRYSPEQYPTGSAHSQWRGGQVGYSGAHRRVMRERGAASECACIQCGQDAQDWAYDHTDQNEIRDGNGRIYSGDPNRYVPMCHGCHSIFDQQWRMEQVNSC
jgi:hypothetical protein